MPETHVNQMPARECLCRFEQEAKRNRAIVRARVLVDAISRVQLCVEASPDKDWSNILEQLIVLAQQSRQALAEIS